MQNERDNTPRRPANCTKPRTATATSGEFVCEAELDGATPSELRFPCAAASYAITRFDVPGLGDLLRSQTGLALQDGRSRVTPFRFDLDPTQGILLSSGCIFHQAWRTSGDDPTLIP